jgi:hypothetical protein
MRFRNCCARHTIITIAMVQAGSITPEQVKAAQVPRLRLTKLSLCLETSRMESLDRSLDHRSPHLSRSAEGATNGPGFLHARVKARSEL